MARIIDLVDENGELLYPISTIGAIYKDNQTAEQWVEGLTNTLNTKIDTHDLEEITSENGVHGIRYFNDVLSYKNMFGEWVELKADKSTILSGTLSIGETSITFTNDVLTEDSIIDIYTDVYGVSPKEVSSSIGNLTLTFDAQNVAVNIKVVVS